MRKQELLQGLLNESEREQFHDTREHDWFEETMQIEYDEEKEHS